MIILLFRLFLLFGYFEAGLVLARPFSIDDCPCLCRDDDIRFLGNHIGLPRRKASPSGLLDGGMVALQ